MTPLLRDGFGEPLRWELCEGAGPGSYDDYIAGPAFPDGIQVMPVAEHQELLKACVELIVVFSAVSGPFSAAGEEFVRFRELVERMS